MQTIDQAKPALESAKNPPGFISIRWRLIMPLTVVVMIVAMIGAYIVARSLSGGFVISENNVLLQSARSAAERSVELYTRHRNEAQRIAFTQGITEGIQTGDQNALLPNLESLAVAANLDSVILLDAMGNEFLGLLRHIEDDEADYVVSSGTSLQDETLVTQTLNDAVIGATGILRTPEGLLLYTAYPITAQESVMGAVLVGVRLNQVLDDLKTSAVADVTLYDGTGTLLQSSFPLTETVPAQLAISDTNLNQTLAAQGQVVIASDVSVNDGVYRAAYLPFEFGPNRLGVISTLVPNNIPFATETGRQMTALFAAGLVGAAVVVVFVGGTLLAARVQRVGQVAQRLAAGERLVRTGMKPTDEVGQVGQALDQYAEVAQAREDQLRQSLRKQRRERGYFMSVLESMPGGVVIQDTQGNVILMNTTARELLSATNEPGLDDQDTAALARVVTDQIGSSIAPGLYALGDPARIDVDDRMVQAQAAAVMSTARRDERLGTVIVLQDVTEMVRQEQAREKLLDELSKDIQQPLAGLAQTGAVHVNQPVGDFARELSRHASTLQKMIVDMRELTVYSPQVTERVQRPLSVETLLWSVANDWRQIAQAAELNLSVIIEKQGLYILGDETRLRWAIGNLVDNAIKYNPAGGSLTLEVKDEVQGMAHLRVRDNGVGIHADDLPYIFTRFFRGTPRTEPGQELIVPGLGQGLPIVKQIIEAHGGRVQVRSKVGVGTAVYFSLPLTAPVGYELPLLDMDVMEGETISIPQDADVDAIWRYKD